MPITLRRPSCETVPMIGPRSRAVGAPQWIGKRIFAPGSGCEVRRIWSGRFGVFIAVVLSSPEKSPTARRNDGPTLWNVTI